MKHFLLAAATALLLFSTGAQAFLLGGNSPPPPPPSLPTQVTDVGFTSQVLNLDFSQVSPDWVSTSVDGCGGPTSGDRWVFRWYFSGDVPPCTRLSLEQDAGIGKQVMHLHYGINDYNGALAMSLSWPALYNVDSNPRFPMASYSEMTFKLSPATLSNQPDLDGAQFGPYFIYGRVLDGNGNWTLEPDFVEVTAHHVSDPPWDGTNQFKDGCLEWDYNYPEGDPNQHPSWCGDFFGDWRDMTVYRKVGVLFTNDGTNYWKCYWLDDAPLGCSGDNGVRHTITLTDHDLNLVLNWGPGGHVAPLNDIDVYVQSVKAYTCAGGFESGGANPNLCITPVVTGN